MAKEDLHDTKLVIAEVADEEKVQEDEVDDEEKTSEEIAAAEVDIVAEVYEVAEETRLKLIKSEVCYV